MKRSQKSGILHRGPTGRERAPAGPVGIVSRRASGLQEVACLLARDGVGLARAIVLEPGAGAPMLAGLRAVQSDPDVEIVILVSEKLPSAAAGRILDQVRASDKPTVVCFLGNAPRLAWRAGAIPATRLDEAAMRAAAWVRGWDQALVSSRLEEERDELAGLAAELSARVARGRRRLFGVFGDEILRHEARLVLSAAVDGALPPDLPLVVGEERTMLRHLSDLFARPEAAAILLSLAAGGPSGLDPAEALEALLREDLHGPGDGGPLLVVHLWDAGCDLVRLAAQESKLRELGVVVAASNASAALLGGLLLAGLEE